MKMVYTAEEVNVFALTGFKQVERQLKRTNKARWVANEKRNVTGGSLLLLC